MNDGSVYRLREHVYQTVMNQYDTLWGRLKTGKRHFGINPGRKRRSATPMQADHWAPDLNVAADNDKRFQGFADLIKSGSWFYLASNMQLWPIEASWEASVRQNPVKGWGFYLLSYIEKYGFKVEKSFCEL